MLFISSEKFFLLSRYSTFYLNFLVMWKNDKDKVNFKIYDVTAWLTNKFNRHISQYLEK